MLRSDEYGNVYDDGQPDPNAVDPSQKYITTYTSDEFGNYFPQQQVNPNFDWKTYDPQGLKEQEDYAATQRGGGGLAGFLSRGPLKRIGDAISEPVRQVSEGFYDAASQYALPLTLGALTYGVGSEFLLPHLMSATGGAAAPATAGGTNALSMAGAPAGFQTPGALGFGGATFGAPSTLAGAQAALATAAAGTSAATSGIAKLAESMGVNKVADMLGMDPTEVMKLAGGVIAGGATALANRGSGDSAPIAQTGFQGQIDPNALKYVGNNKYIQNPVVKAAAGGGIRGLGMRGMAPIEYKAGGKYLSGPGDGMSDNIKANIEGKQEARLADGEFVIPADVVSHIGNGSSNAGAKKLHAMMDRIREARTGNPKQGKQIKAEKFLPA
jgi:hypothetical protein